MKINTFFPVIQVKPGGFFLFGVMIWMMIACNPSSQTNNQQNQPQYLNPIPQNAQEIPVRFARGFHLYRDENKVWIDISNPWQQAQNIHLYYVLMPASELSKGKSAAQQIIVPLQRIACMSTTHLGFLQALNCSDRLIAFSGTQYVYNEEILSRIHSNEIHELGYEQSLNFEKLIQLQPDLLINYGVTAEISAVSEKLRSLKIPSFLSAEYLEEHPLGKAEWVRVFGLLLGKEQLADSIFNEIASRYLELKKLTDTITQKPLVMTGLPWKDAWYLTGRNSYLPQFIEDAGGNYFNAKHENREPLALSIEAVYELGHEADFWINAGTSHSIASIIQTDPRLADFKPVKNRQVFNNNLRMSPGDGNDYFESGTIEPDIILKEIIQIIHPQLIQDKSFKYYRRLELN